MKVRVGFSRTNTFISKAIRIITKSEVSHVYLRIEDEFLGVPLILHSDKHPGVCVVHAPIFEADNEIVAEFEIEAELLEYAIRKNFSLLGKEYDKWRLFAWAWVIAISRWVHRKLRDPTEDPRKLICVDFVLLVLNAAKITNLGLGSMTPKDLHQYFKQHFSIENWKKIK